MTDLMEAAFARKLRSLEVSELIRSYVCSMPELVRDLLRLSHSDHRRTSVNALWALTHLRPFQLATYPRLQSELIDRLQSESDPSKRRIILQLLREQTLYPGPEEVVALLDYCFSKINSEWEPYAVRANCIHIAYKISRRYPELLAELRLHLDLLSSQTLTPGLRSALRQTLKKITKSKKQRHEKII